MRGGGVRIYMQHWLAVGPQRPTASRILKNQNHGLKSGILCLESGVLGLESGVLILESYFLVKHAKLHVNSA